MTWCECGLPYYPESTGEGPCHYRCSCGTLVDIDDSTEEMYENGYCKKCMEQVYDDNRNECDMDEYDCADCSFDQQQYCGQSAYSEDVNNENRGDI